MLDGSYITAEEAGVLVALQLASRDERRTALEALSGADQAVCCRQASEDLDAQRWLGCRASASQGLAWPRRWPGGATLYGRWNAEAPVPAGLVAWSVPGLPDELRRACAIQAARRATEALGLSQRRQVRDDAALGVTSRSGGSGGLSIDTGHAGAAWARLDPDAAALVAIFRSAGGEMR